MFYNVQDDRRPLACGDTVTLKGANGSREKYFIDRVAGVGGMSITYIARKEGDGRWVAIKELFPKRLEGLVAKRREDGRIVIFNPLTQTELNDSPAVWNELIGFMERESELSRRAADLYASGAGISQNNADILCILGLTSIVKPLENATLNYIDFGIMTFISLLLLIFIASGKVLNRIEGAILLLIYIGYTVFLCR